MSTNLDPSCNRGFHQMNLGNPNLQAALSALSPSRLRFGGSGGDSLLYGLGNASVCAGLPPAPAPPANGCSFGTPGCLNESTWSRLYALSSLTSTPLTFGISYGGEHSCSASYDWAAGSGYTNAQRLLAYMAAHNQSLYGFELGNEVNLGAPSCHSTPAQQASALAALAALAPGAVLAGPDTGDINASAWLQGYLPLASPILNAATHHQYNGATQANWDSPTQLDALLPEMTAYVTQVHALAPHAEVWAGEVGPHGGGENGTCNAGAICGTFASSLWYADDLGLRARAGYHHHQRQDLIGGAYGMTVGSLSGPLALSPTEPLTLLPDFYTAFLWKRTLGVSVLGVASSLASVRAYAFSGPPPSPHAHPACSAVNTSQYLLLNLAPPAPGATVAQLPPAPPGARYAAWSLAAGAQGVFGAAATLNGLPLQQSVNVGAASPSAFLSGIVQPPVQGAAADGVVLPPHSTTFVCVG